MQSDEAGKEQYISMHKGEDIGLMDYEILKGSTFFGPYLDPYFWS